MLTFPSAHNAIGAKPLADKNDQETNRLLDRPLDRARLHATVKPAELGMAPLALEALLPGTPLPVDLYLPLANRKHGVTEVEMSLAARRGDVFQRSWRDRLLKAEQKRVYVSLDQAEDVSNYFDQHARALMEDPDLTNRRKAVVVQTMADANLRILFHGSMEPAQVEHSVRRAHETVRRVLTQSQLLNKLTEVLRSDFSIYSHSVNVSMLAMAFGRYLGLPASQVETLGMGGLLHDVGWAKLPADLREKRGVFSPQERAEMQRHPRLGYQVLAPVGAVPFDVLQIVLHHHENADGSGYPGGLTSGHTPFLARVTRVVDAFDAMTSRRVYKDPVSAFEAASTLMQEMSEAFGQDLVPRFIRFLGSPSFAP